MKKLAIALGVVALMSVGACTRPKLAAVASPEAQVKAVVDAMVEASEKEDMALMSKIVCHCPRVVQFGTLRSERLVGWDAFETVMKSQFAAFDKMNMTVRNQVIRVHHSNEVAWFSQVMDLSFELNGKAGVMDGLRCTGVLVNGKRGWQIVQCHFSVPQEEEGSKPARQAEAEAKAQVKAVLDAVVEANEKEDLVLLRSITCQCHPIVQLGSGADQRFVGWAAFEAAMKKQFDRYDKMQITVRDQVIGLYHSNRVAWFSQLMDLRFEVDGKPGDIKGVRYTGVVGMCEKKNRWQIVQGHLSMPATEEASEPAPKKPEAQAEAKDKLKAKK